MRHDIITLGLALERGLGFATDEEESFQRKRYRGAIEKLLEDINKCVDLVNTNWGEKKAVKRRKKK